MGSLRPDIEAAKSKRRGKVGGGSELRQLESHLLEGERVKRVTIGRFNTHPGLVVLTDRRLLFTVEGRGKGSCEAFSLDEVASATFEAGRAAGTIAISTGTMTAEIKTVANVDGEALVECIRARLEGDAPLAVATPVTPSPAPADDEPSDDEPINPWLKFVGVVIAINALIWLVRQVF